MSKNFTDKVAVVTGAGRGIGRAIALELAARGAKVAVVSRREETSQDTAQKISESGGEARAYAVDVADTEAVTALGKQIASDFGGVDILVNNAGVTRDNLSARIKEADWDLVLDTNLKGAFNMMKALQRSLLRSSSPRIINIGSVIGLMGNAGQANYAASKAGLIGLSKSLAREFASRKVTVNVVAPGYIATDMTDGLGEEVREGILGQTPLGRLGQVDDVVAAVTFLASDEASFITGQVLAVDGGLAMI